MEENSKDLLIDSELQLNLKKRKQLLPLWIKIFAWIFIVFGLVVPIGIILGVLGYNFQISLYGFETTGPISLIGIALSILFLLKAVVAFGLITEKDWAIKLAIVDAIIGILVCIYAMVYPIINPQPGLNASLRLELIALIPYLLKMKKIQFEWENYLSV